jgi:hypothetical protein
LGLNILTIYDRLAKFTGGGQNALLAKPISGRPPKDSVRQQFKFEFGLWASLRCIKNPHPGG